MPREKVIRAAGYIRESDQGQSKYSPIFQEKQIIAYCRAEGIAIRKEHIFYDGQTGKYWRDRDQLKELLAAAKRHEFDVLVLYRLDRFSRNHDHQIIIREQLAYYGVRIVTLDPEEHSDDDTITGKIIREIYALMAELELKKIRDRCQDGLKERFETDKKIPVARRPLYGYMYDDASQGEKGKYIPKPTTVFVDREGNEWTEAQVVAYMHELTDYGSTSRSISLELNNLDIPTADGKKIWRHQVVYAILTNDTYATGTVYANKRKYTYQEGGSMHREFRDQKDWIAIENGAIPIISIERFKKTQDNLRKNKKFSYRRGGDTKDALLRCGMATCALCGSNMYVHRQRTEGRANYVCSLHRKGYKECPGVQVECHILDAEVWQKAVKIIRHPELLEAQLEKKREEDPLKDDIENLDRLIADLVTRIRNIIVTIENGEDSSKYLVARLHELEAQKDRFEDERDRLVRQQIDWQEEQENIEAFKRKCADLRPHLDKAEVDYDFKVDAIDYLGIRVVVNKPDQEHRFVIETAPDELSFVSASLKPR